MHLALLAPLHTVSVRRQQHTHMSTLGTYLARHTLSHRLPPSSRFRTGQTQHCHIDLVKHLLEHVKHETFAMQCAHLLQLLAGMFELLGMLVLGWRACASLPAVHIRLRCAASEAVSAHIALQCKIAHVCGRQFLNAL